MKFIPLFLLAYGVAFGGDQGWIANEGGTTIKFFDTATNKELTTASLTLSGAPTFMATNAERTSSPSRVFALVPSQNKIEVVKTSNLTKEGEVTSGPLGTFQNPVSLRQMKVDSNTTLKLVMVQNKDTGSNIGVISIMDPIVSSLTNAVEHEFRDYRGKSPAPTYKDVAYSYTTNQKARLWVSDSATSTVLTINLGALNMSQIQNLGQVLVEITKDVNGNVISGFVEKVSVTSPGKMLASENRLYVATGNTVTVVDADYLIGKATTSAVVTTVSIGANVLDMFIAGGKLYALTDNADATKRVKVVKLSDLTTSDIGVTSGTQSSLSVTTDDKFLYVIGSTDSYQIDLSNNTLKATFALTGLSTPNNTIIIKGSGSSSTTSTGLTPNAGGGSICSTAPLRGDSNSFPPIILLVLFTLIYLFALVRGQRRSEI